MASLADNVARVISVFNALKSKVKSYVAMNDGLNPLKIEEYVNAIDTVFKSGVVNGKQFQYEDFAEYFCTSGERKNGNWIRAFANDVNLFPYLKGITIQPIIAYQMFYGYLGSLKGDLQQILDDNNVKIDFSKCTNFQYSFANTQLTRIGVVDTSSATTISQLFFSSSELVTVDKLIPNEAMPYAPYAFQGCYALKNIRIEGKFGRNVSFANCPLVKDSILSVFNALSTTVTDKTLTLKKSAVNTAFGINVDDVTTYSDEWRSLTDSKKNWNIAYE